MSYDLNHMCIDQVPNMPLKHHMCVLKCKNHISTIYSLNYFICRCLRYSITPQNALSTFNAGYALKHKKKLFHIIIYNTNF